MCQPLTQKSENLDMGITSTVSGEGLAPIVSAYSRLILVDGTVL